MCRLSDRKVRIIPPMATLNDTYKVLCQGLVRVAWSEVLKLGKRLSEIVPLSGKTIVG